MEFYNIHKESTITVVPRGPKGGMGVKRKAEVPAALTESPHDHPVSKQMIEHFGAEWSEVKWQEVLKQLTLPQLISFRETINTRSLGLDGKAVRIFDIFTIVGAMKENLWLNSTPECG